jgi:hypothetical protein
MVMAGTSHRRLLRGKQRAEALPLGVAEGPPDRGPGEDGGAGRTLDRTPARVPLLAPRGVAAGGTRLVGPSPARPLEPKGSLVVRFAQRQDQAADLGHGQRNAVGRRPPFSAVASLARAR